MADAVPPAGPDRSSAAKRYRLRARVTLEKAGQLPVEADVHEISRTGMFVATASTFPAGTPLQFVVRPAQRSVEPIRGRLTVVWRRQLSAGPGRPAGVGCSFEAFDAGHDGDLSAWLEANPTLEIDRATPDRSSLTRELSRFAAETQIQEPTDSWDATEMRSGSVRRSTLPTWLAWALAAIALLSAALLASIWVDPSMVSPHSMQETPSSEITPASTGSETTTQSASAGPEPRSTQHNEARGDLERQVSTSALETESTPATALTPTVAASTSSAVDVASENTSDAQPRRSSGSRLSDRQAQRIRLTVRQWAAAWSDQQAESYLAFYAPSFDPGSGTTLAAWSELRRRRIGAPAYVRVTVSDLEVRSLPPTDRGTETAQVTFTQGYESPSYRDEVFKTLTVERADTGDWRIVAEKSSALR